MHRIGFVLAIVMTLASACTPLASGTDRKTAPVVLASTTFLADIARNIAGDRLQVDSLLPVGADPHSYQSVPVDVARIQQSDILIVNGLDYENFLQPLLENAGGQRLIVTASNGLEPHRVKDGTGDMVTDPHMWLDPNRVVKYAENIRDGLIQFDPKGTDVYKANAAAYISQLKELDSWIVGQVSQIPRERR